MSNFSTINFRDFPNSDSINLNQQFSDNKNDNLNIIDKKYNGSSFGAIDEKGESNCPSY